MGDNKITPWDDYNYSAKLPDFWEVAGIGLGVGLCKAYQTSLRRPLTRRSSVALMTAYMVGGYMIGKAGVIIRDNSYRRRQVFIDDYMDKHPEDFLTTEIFVAPVFIWMFIMGLDSVKDIASRKNISIFCREPKKFKDVLWEWTPHR